MHGWRHIHQAIANRPKSTTSLENSMLIQNTSQSKHHMLQQCCQSQRQCWAGTALQLSNPGCAFHACLYKYKFEPVCWLDRQVLASGVAGDLTGQMHR